MNPVKECDCRRIDDNFVFLSDYPWAGYIQPWWRVEKGF